MYRKAVGEMGQEHGGTLPQADQVSVPQAKVRDYLLNPFHPKGASKAAFFALEGFTRERWQELADALRKHGQNHPVVSLEVTNHGMLYVVEGVLHTPSNKRPVVRSVWIKDTDDPPRLVTAYPIKR